MRLVYLSPVAWASFAQRPHKFVEWFHARHGGEVLWIDPYPTRLPNLSDFKRASENRGVNNKTIPNWLTVIRPRSLPLEPIPGASILNYLLWNPILQSIDTFSTHKECLIGIGKPSELALQVLSRHAFAPSIYDAMDNFPAFYSGISKRSIEKRENIIASKVSKIFVSSTALLNRYADFRSKLALILNACTIDNLPSENIMKGKTSHIILGYVGTIGHWFDWGLVYALAETNPNMCIRLIGPIYSFPPRSLPSNIELLPACDHERALLAMQEFTVGLIPFKRTNLTASVDPIKYYEYSAIGLPIISSCFGEMALRNKQQGVFIIDGKDDLVGIVRAAIEYEYEVEFLRKFRIENTWEARFNKSAIIPKSG